MQMPPPRPRKARAPAATADTPPASSLPNLSGIQQRDAPTSTPAEAWADAYRDLHDKY